MGIGIAKIALELAVFIRFLAESIINGVAVDISRKGKLDAAAPSLHAGRRIQHLKLSTVAVSGIGDLDLGNILSVHVCNSGTIRDVTRILKLDIDDMVYDPGI